jgi:hypothetical protein
MLKLKLRDIIKENRHVCGEIKYQHRHEMQMYTTTGNTGQEVRS